MALPTRIESGVSYRGGSILVDFASSRQRRDHPAAADAAMIRLFGQYLGDLRRGPHGRPGRPALPGPRRLAVALDRLRQLGDARAVKLFMWACRVRFFYESRQEKFKKFVVDCSTKGNL